MDKWNSLPTKQTTTPKKDFLNSCRGGHILNSKYLPPKCVTEDYISFQTVLLEDCRSN